MLPAEVEPRGDLRLLEVPNHGARSYGASCGSDARENADVSTTYLSQSGADCPCE